MPRHTLHVAVLDAIVHHFHKVASTAGAHPVAARLAIRLGRDRLENILDVGPECVQGMADSSVKAF